MPLEERQECIRRIEQLRPGRVCVCFFNFDRESVPGIEALGLSTMFSDSSKEPLFRVLKETVADGKKLDLCLYTRGGSLNAVWPIVSLLREFDEDFEVLVPFRCHSAGTIVSLGAARIVLTRLSELSPIDPTCGNQFNPLDPVNNSRIGISVEDVVAYREFILTCFGIEDREPDEGSLETEAVQPAYADPDRTSVLSQFLRSLTTQVHPLALGNVYRVQRQGRRLARELLRLHNEDHAQIHAAVEELSSKFFSHMHMINRHEAKLLLDESRVEFADQVLESALDDLLRAYEKDFALRRKFVVLDWMGADNEKEARFIGAAVESAKWSYLNETKLLIRMTANPPPNVQIQLPPGQALGRVPGLPTKIECEVLAQGWIRNTDPVGVTK